MPRVTPPPRQRVGRVSFFQHHGSWYVYHRHRGKAHRQHVGANASVAECHACLLNARLVAAEAGLSFEKLLAGRCGPASADPAAPPSPEIPNAITVAELRQAFLAHHEHVIASSLQTVARYRTATLYLESFARRENLAVADVPVARFVQHLRAVEVAPNGHPNTPKRRLRDKGIRYILECCRSMFHFGLREGMLPRERANPFTQSGLAGLRVRDAKPVFVFNPQAELAFFSHAKPWAWGVHFLLAKTGLRPGELVRLLVEDLDLAGGWFHVRGKAELGWTTKTHRDRRVPLIPETLSVVQAVLGGRTRGPLILRQNLNARTCPLLGRDRTALATEVAARSAAMREQTGRALNRTEVAKVCQGVWRDAGAAEVDRVRTSFIAAAKAAGLSATCPKSWRHTFATLLQEANIDLLVRQETLGHQPAPGASALGMTAIYTHTTPDVQRREVERALRLRPQTLALAERRGVAGL
ncbi:MAG: site-specific tyrosine recombinase XerC [Phycisphaerales bacterium]|nr:site-specific tyrosine recombinase XerC [Phycisphaerales bacterium]